LQGCGVNLYGDFRNSDPVAVQKLEALLNQEPVLSDSVGALSQAPQKYFELIVNTGEYSTTLGEIDISSICSDGELFRRIRERYLEIRGYRARKVFLIKPVSFSFVKVSNACMHSQAKTDFPYSNLSPDLRHKR
jgi:hypothetical protein